VCVNLRHAVVGTTSWPLEIAILPEGMTKLIVRAKPPSSSEVRRRSVRIQYYVAAFPAVVMGLLLLYARTNPSTFDLVVRSALATRPNNQVGYRTLLLACLVGVLVLVISAIIVCKSTLRRNKYTECAISVSATGVHLPSGRRRQPFLPRERLTDIRVDEVIQANRVYSSLTLLVKSTSTDGAIEAMEVFPGVELTYAECVQVRRKFLQLLPLASTERHQKY
jgi:hypothetical protein